MFTARIREVADTSTGDNTIQTRGAVGRGRNRSRHGKKARRHILTGRGRPQDKGESE
jgi:hypothetical protein